MTRGDGAAKSMLTPDQQVDYLSYLSKAVREINESTDFNATLKSIAHAMIPHISDWCAVDILQPDGKLERLATAHIDPKKIEKALELGQKYPRDPKADSGSTKVLRSGEPEMFNGITDELLVGAAINDEHLGMMRAMDFHALMIVPIKSRNKILGTITFVWAESRKVYSLADLAFAEILAAVAGSAVDNAQLAA